MASKDNKPPVGKKKFPKLGKRDHKVKPAEDSEGANDSAELNTISKQVENNKLTERELKKVKKVEEERMKAIDKDNRRIKRRMLRKEVRKDIVQTTSESCATFCFVFVVGSTLLGGGTALIVKGRENNIFDFVVVGATGLVVGVIFTATGLYLFIKPLYDKHSERKTRQTDAWGEKNEEAPTSPYIDQENALKLKSQIDDLKRQKRRPSNAELYFGEEASFDNVNSMNTPRDDSFVSYSNPPFLAVPNNERESFSKKPVLLLDAKEDPLSPKKSKSKSSKIRSSTTTAAAVVDNNNENASVSLVNETEERQVRESQDYNAVNIEGNKYHEPKSDTEINKSNDSPSKENNEMSNYDQVLKHASRNMIVVDYSLLDDLGSPPSSPEAKTNGGSDVDRVTEPRPHRSNGERSNQEGDGQGQDLSDLTSKLYEKHPDVVHKHKKRSKKQSRHSEKRPSSLSQPEITVPLEDSEPDGAESMC